MTLIIKNALLCSGSNVLLSKIPCGHIGGWYSARLVKALDVPCNPSFDMCDLRRSRIRRVLCWSVLHKCGTDTIRLISSRQYPLAQAVILTEEGTVSGVYWVAHFRKGTKQEIQKVRRRTCIYVSSGPQNVNRGWWDYRDDNTCYLTNGNVRAITVDRTSAPDKSSRE